MKSNVLFVGLVEGFVKDVAKLVSSALDIMYVDVKELIEYDLIDAKSIESVCGVDYLAKRENSVLKSVREYENTGISIGYNLLFGQGNALKFQSSAYIIYIRIPKSLAEQQLNAQDQVKTGAKIDLIDFSIRDADLKNIANLVFNVNILSAQKVAQSILNRLKSI